MTNKKTLDIFLEGMSAGIGYRGMGSGKSFFVRDLKYYFHQNDEVTINLPFKEPISGFVIEYNPEIEKISERLLVKDIDGNEYRINPSLATPLHHKNTDTRTRIYLNHDDKHRDLHLLMNQHIVCLPTHKLGETKEYSSLGKISSFIIDKITAGDSMFIYAGYDHLNKHYINQQVRYNSNGEIETQFHSISSYQFNSQTNSTRNK